MKWVLRKLSLKNPSFLGWLILLDVFMSLSAFRVDWSDFFVVPWYLVLFVPICPIYPLLLAVNFFIFQRRNFFFQPLLHFTLIGIFSYGLMAYLFYPSYMLLRGFQWYEFGNLLWVTLYASQFFLLKPFLKKINVGWYILFSVYFLAKDFLDRFGDTFSYQRAGEFTEFQANLFFGGILLLHIVGLLLIPWHAKKSKNVGQR